MLVKTTFCNAARAAIRALISKITSAASVTTARRLAPNRYFLRATPGPGICSSPSGTRAWRISQLNAAAVRIAVSQWQLSFARRSPGSTSRNLIANFATDVEHVHHVAGTGVGASSPIPRRDAECGIAVERASSSVEPIRRGGGVVRRPSVRRGSPPLRPGRAPAWPGSATGKRSTETEAH